MSCLLVVCGLEERRASERRVMGVELGHAWWMFGKDRPTFVRHCCPWGFDVLIASKLRFAQGGHALGRAVTS